MTHMLDSDWMKKFLLRSDWLPTEVVLCTTGVSTQTSIFQEEKGHGISFCFFENFTLNTRSNSLFYLFNLKKKFIHAAF